MAIKNEVNKIIDKHFNRNDKKIIALKAELMNYIVVSLLQGYTLGFEHGEKKAKEELENK